LEGQDESGPVPAVSRHLFFFGRTGVARAGSAEALGGQPPDSLAEPVQSNDQQEGADHEPEDPYRDCGKSQPKDGHQHCQHHQAAPARAPRQPLATPTPATMATISMPSTAEARNVVTATARAALDMCP